MLGFQTYPGDVSGLNVHLLDISNKKVTDFTSQKQIVLKLWTHERLAVRGPWWRGSSSTITYRTITSKMLLLRL